MVAVMSSSNSSAYEIHRVGCAAPPVAEEDWGSTVALFADNVQDSVRINGLLKNSKADSLAVSLCHVSALPAQEAFAAVVCYRQGAACVDTTLPHPIRAQRLIVLSDCTRESTVLRLIKRGARHVFDLHDNDTVLQARLEAALRRHRNVLMRSFSVADVHFDVQRRKVVRDGLQIDLSPKEFDFASYIFSRQGKIVVNSELMTAVWSLPPHMDTRRIDTAACRVRKKLGLCGNRGWELKRIRCVGYRLTRIEPNVVELGR